MFFVVPNISADTCTGKAEHQCDHDAQLRTSVRKHPDCP